MPPPPSLLPSSDRNPGRRVGGRVGPWSSILPGPDSLLSRRCIAVRGSSRQWSAVIFGHDLGTRSTMLVKMLVAAVLVAITVAVHAGGLGLVLWVLSPLRGAPPTRP